MPGPKPPSLWTAPDWRSELPSDDPVSEEIWCYAERFSYAPGETARIFVHTTAETYDLEIMRDGARPSQVFLRQDVPGFRQTTNDAPYAAGCGWRCSHEIEIDADWASGFYLILCRFRDWFGALVEREGFFVVRARERREHMVLVLTTSTMMAYNDWGGANHYRGLSDDPRADVHSPVLSTQRPVARGMLRLPAGAPREGYATTPALGEPPRYRSKEWARLSGRSRHYASAFWATYERHFVVWAERAGYSFDYLTQHDLDRDPQALEGYRCAIVVGHDEYWSWRMRDALDAFLGAGGNLARFAGNFTWQVRLEDEGRLQICYKNKAADPTEDRRLTTVVWDHPIVGRPGAESVGLTGLGGVYTRYGACTPRSSGGLTVYRPDHWVFAGTDLYYGDALGAVPVGIASFEVDGVEYTFRRGLPYPTHEDGAPDDLEILAMCPAVAGERDRWNGEIPLNSQLADFHQDLEQQFEGDEIPEHLRDREYGSGMLAVCTRGRGTVVNAGTTDWVVGLLHRDPFVERITRNVLDRLGVLETEGTSQ